MTKTFLFYIIVKRLRDNACADMAQMVEHILGKDEVTGSIPVISSKNPCLNGKGYFFRIHGVYYESVIAKW